MNDDTIHTTMYDSIQTVAKRMPCTQQHAKERINLLLWELLPGTTTITQAEKIACDLLMAIKEDG